MNPPCFLIRPPSVEVVYVHPINGDLRYKVYAERFLNSWLENPPGFDYKLTVVLNGGTVNREIEGRFKPLAGCQFLEHNNVGWDIGAYQIAAEKTSCELIVFFAASTYFQRPGWLKRMVEASMEHGLALYGAMGNGGDIPIGVYPHIRTTAFWMHPAIMDEYPVRVVSPEQRYPFEHGRDCLTSWILEQGLKAWVVTWTGDYPWPLWENIPNGMHRGDQSALLAGDRLTIPPFYPPDSAIADAPQPQLIRARA